MGETFVENSAMSCSLGANEVNFKWLRSILLNFSVWSQTM